MIRVLVVDDHAVVRSGVRAEIGDVAEVVGEAGDVDEAIAAIRALRPDVVLLDVHLPGGGGRAVLDGVAAEYPQVRFLALSVSDAAQDVIGVIRGGARGYVTKAITGAELCEAIRRIHEGDAYFSPRLAGFVLDTFTGDTPPGLDPELDQLTRRERDVLRRRRPATRTRRSGPAGHLRPYRRDVRRGGAAQAATLQPAGAVPVGQRAPLALDPRTGPAVPDGGFQRFQEPRDRQQHVRRERPYGSGGFTIDNYLYNGPVAELLSEGIKKRGGGGGRLLGRARAGV